MRRIAPALALSLGLSVGTSATEMVFGQQAPQTKASERFYSPGESGPSTSPAELSRAFINVAKQVKPAVVNIDVFGASRTSAVNRPRGYPQIPGYPNPRGMQPAPYAKRGTGSGVIISADGYILTNNHVAGTADEIKVKMSDGREFRARRIGTDPETDLALIKVDASNLPFASLGDSSRLEQGEWVIALGSPFGLDQTMTAGIVSATGRDLRRSAYDNFIQTDASINPGNSGGPLVNMAGEVVGINTMIFSRSGGSEGIGFAVPSNLAKKVYEQLLKNGKVYRGFLGVNLQMLTPETAKSTGYSGKEGAVVGSLTPNSPAARAGLRNGDVITEFDGQAVKSAKHLTEIVGDTPVGKSVQVKFIRNNREQTTTITLAERPGRNISYNQKPNNQGEYNVGAPPSSQTGEKGSQANPKTGPNAAADSRLSQ